MHLAAVAALQGWDSVTGYACSQSGRPRGKLSAFEWESDPATTASVAVGALLFRRGDVEPARRTVAGEPASRRGFRAGPGGGEGGIRTPGAREGSAVFETAPFGRSGTSPGVSITEALGQAKY